MVWFSKHFFQSFFVDQKGVVVIEVGQILEGPFSILSTEQFADVECRLNAVKSSFSVFLTHNLLQNQKDK